MFPHLPHPASPIDLLDNKIPGVGIVGRNGLTLEDPAIEALSTNHSTSSAPGIRRHDVVVAPLLPSRPVSGTDCRAERRVDLEEAIVVVASVVEAEAAVRVESGFVAGKPVGVVGGRRSRIRIECFMQSLAIDSRPVFSKLVVYLRFGILSMQRVVLIVTSSHLQHIRRPCRDRF